MTNLIIRNEETLINSKEIRNSFMGRTDVLERVKDLALLPGSELATSAQVANFYGIDKNAIRALVHDYRDELESDGMHFLRYSEIKELIEVTPNLNEMNALGINRAGTNVFTKRAILRVGMLLRFREVAKEVRTQLLNIEEHASVEVKTFEINNELQLQANVGIAVASGNMAEVIKAIKELEEYNNRHVIEKAEKYDAFLDEGGTINITTLGKQFLEGMTARKVREILQAKGILFMKQTNGAYLPRKGYEKYFFIKIAEYNGVQNNQTRVTREGIDFIVDLVNK